MSSISEVYAKDLGVKIGKAKITEHFHPIPAEKYITFFKDDPSQVNQYEYWEVVLSLLNPIFQKYEIKGLEIYDNKNQSVKQNNFLIKNSELYLGIANHFMVTADIYKKPSVCLLPNSYSNNINSKYSKVITPDFSSIKPSFSAQEAKKRINEILPEDIAQSVLVIFNYSAKHEKIDLKNFIKKLKGNKIKFAIEVQDEELFSDVSLKYFDHNVIRKNNLNTTSIPDTECEFFSKKKFISNNNVFNSEFSSKTLDNSSKFVYNEISKLEIESLYLYVKK